MKHLQTAIILLLLFAAALFVATPSEAFATRTKAQDTPPAQATALPEKQSVGQVETLPYITQELPPPTQTAEATEELRCPAPGYDICVGGCFEATCPFFDGYPENKPYTDADVDMVAKTVWGEARGCTPDEWRLVAWTILQRIDDPRWPDTFAAVIMEPNQFSGYHGANPVDDGIREVCFAAIQDWAHGAEPPTHSTYAPTAPYLFFDGDGQHNWFRGTWR